MQVKNITYPTDAKLYRRVINQCNKVAKKVGVTLRQSYKFVVKKLTYALRSTRLKNHQKATNHSRPPGKRSTEKALEAKASIELQAIIRAYASRSESRKKRQEQVIQSSCARGKLYSQGEGA
ncbi:MAG: hypothetical protein AAFO91_20185 [Bacteroidota bacterium]